MLFRSHVRLYGRVANKTPDACTRSGFRSRQTTYAPDIPYLGGSLDGRYPDGNEQQPDVESAGYGHLFRNDDFHDIGGNRLADILLADFQK